MLSVIIDDPEIENYFDNSADKIKDFLEKFVNDATFYTQDSNVSDKKIELNN